MAEPEVWLRGPVDGVAPLLQPVAHALLQAREDVVRLVANLEEARIWAPCGAGASVGFHLKHLAGSLDRLLTYARGEALSPDQLAFARSEGDPGNPPADAATLAALVTSAVDKALVQVRQTPEGSLQDARRVGRQGLPSTVLGLLFHAAEHATRHVGQTITTVKAGR
jgi:hypothetical protein